MIKITFQAHMKTVQAFPDPPFCVLVIIITPSAAEGGSGFKTNCNDGHFNTCTDCSAPFPFFVSSVMEFLLQCIVILYKWWRKWLSNGGNFVRLLDYSTLSTYHDDDHGHRSTMVRSLLFMVM